LKKEEEKLKKKDEEKLMKKDTEKLKNEKSIFWEKRKKRKEIYDLTMGHLGLSQKVEKNELEVERTQDKLLSWKGELEIKHSSLEMAMMSQEMELKQLDNEFRSILKKINCESKIVCSQFEDNGKAMLEEQKYDALQEFDAVLNKRLAKHKNNMLEIEASLEKRLEAKFQEKMEQMKKYFEFKFEVYERQCNQNFDETMKESAVLRSLCKEINKKQDEKQYFFLFSFFSFFLFSVVLFFFFFCFSFFLTINVNLKCREKKTKI
jgi:hypothetical protein